MASRIRLGRWVGLGMARRHRLGFSGVGMKPLATILITLLTLGYFIGVFVYFESRDNPDTRREQVR